ncbi:MAG: hypothetical protein M0Z38_06760 [Deltaproteobacteria bacterium]|nr:hypothetical protein [Deltaproteobacteria bacterium]
MALDFAADLDTMFSTAEHAVLATYTRQWYAAVQIPVIFDNEYIVTEGVEGRGIGSTAPVAVCKTADVPYAAPDDLLEVGGTTYNVILVKPDGTGVTMLVLSEDPA